MIKNRSLPTDRRSENLHQIIRGSYTLKSKVVRKNNENHKQSGKLLPCVSRLNNLCCEQVKQTNTIKSYRKNQVFKVFHDLTCISVNSLALSGVTHIWDILPATKILFDIARIHSKSPALKPICREY